MALPGLGGLDAAGASFAGAVTARLRAIGFDRGFVDGLAAGLPGLPAPMQLQGLDWLTLEDRRPAALALRLFVLHHRLTRPESGAMLGEGLFLQALQAGLLACEDDAVSFPLRLDLVNQLMLLSDTPGDEPERVMAVGGSTQLLARASYPQQDIDRALDLGCGSGLLALLLAPACREVVGTDLNPRALVLARFNAALNGIGNVHWRLGDRFAPVAGESFDLVVTQPPFLPLPEGADPVLFLHGGARGDELALAVLAQARAHLRPGGLAFVLSDFPELPRPLGERLHEAVPEGGLLLVRADETTASATQATLYGGSGDGAARRSLLLHRHLQRMCIAEIAQAVVVLHEGGGLREWRIGAADWPMLHRRDIDAKLSAAPGWNTSAGTA